MKPCKHNIKLERVEAIVTVMRESKQARGVLSESEGCYCALGCIAEAYRRAHPDNSRWSDIRRLPSGGTYRDFVIDVTEGSLIPRSGTLPYVVKEWALNARYREAMIFFDENRFTVGVLMDSLNDSKGKSLSWFADVLEGKEV